MDKVNNIFPFCSILFHFFTLSTQFPALTSLRGIKNRQASQPAGPVSFPGKDQKQ